MCIGRFFCTMCMFLFHSLSILSMQNTNTFFDSLLPLDYFDLKSIYLLLFVYVFIHNIKILFFFLLFSMVSCVIVSLPVICFRFGNVYKIFGFEFFQKYFRMISLYFRLIFDLGFYQQYNTKHDFFLLIVKFLWIVNAWTFYTNPFSTNINSFVREFNIYSINCSPLFFLIIAPI